MCLHGATHHHYKQQIVLHESVEHSESVLRYAVQSITHLLISYASDPHLPIQIKFKSHLSLCRVQTLVLNPWDVHVVFEYLQQTISRLCDHVQAKVPTCCLNVASTSRSTAG